MVGLSAHTHTRANPAPSGPVLSAAEQLMKTTCSGISTDPHTHTQNPPPGSTAIMSGASSSAGSSNKLADFKARLAKLHSKRNEAAVLNHKEVVEEDRVKQMPKNYAKKRERLEKEFAEDQRREEIEQEGKDYDRVRMLEVGADEAERWERKKKKKNPDQGFSTYEDATIRQYKRLINNKKVSLEEYNREKEAVGEAAFYGHDNTIAIGIHKDSKEAIDSMVDDLEKQISKREKYSRRRIFDDDADINFINERNMKFNKKLERFYGDYTEEIKQNLERGTAV